MYPCVDGMFFLFRHAINYRFKLILYPCEQARGFDHEPVLFFDRYSTKRLSLVWLLFLQSLAEESAVYHICNNPFTHHGNPCRCDFPMQRCSIRPDVKYRCANCFHGLRGQPSANRRLTSNPLYRCALRNGCSSQFLTIYLSFRTVSAAEPACKIYPDEEAVRASRKGETKKYGLRIIKF